MVIATGTRLAGVERRRTTLALPVDLLEAIDREVQSGRAENRAAVVTEALSRELRRREQIEIDDNLRQMKHDARYLAEQAQIMSEFVGADAETARAVPD